MRAPMPPPDRRRHVDHPPNELGLGSLRHRRITPFELLDGEVVSVVQPRDARLFIALPMRASRRGTFRRAGCGRHEGPQQRLVNGNAYALMMSRTVMPLGIIGSTCSW